MNVIRSALCFALLTLGLIGQDRPAGAPRSPALTDTDRAAIRDLEAKIYREDRVQAQSRKRQDDLQARLQALLLEIRQKTGCVVRETEPPEEKLVCAELPKPEKK